MRVQLGWGAHAVPAPRAVNFTAAGVNTSIPSSRPDDDWIFADGAGLSPNRNQSAGGNANDIRSGAPGQASMALVSHPLNSDGHLLSSIAFSFQYVAGYTPPAGASANASTLSVALVDALNRSVVEVVYTSPPLGDFSFDHFTGYSPPIAWQRTGLSIAWPRSLCLALLFDNRQRNVQLPLSTLSLSVAWSSRRQPTPFRPSDLRTPPVNAAAITRGPLLFGLPPRPTVTTLHVPAAGGECEAPSPGGRSCKSRDLSFELAPAQRWNYALLLPADAPSTALTFERSADRAPKVPFDPSAPPLSILVPARPLPAWRAIGDVTQPPPPSPVDDLLRMALGAGGDDSSGTTLRLVPFGSTQVRIAAFPWARP